jgi:NTE family protein
MVLTQRLARRLLGLAAALAAAPATADPLAGMQAYTLPELQAQAPAPVPGRLGIAFGGGGVRGFVHMGVIRALEESGLHADIVTGTSAGSIAATLYASGKPYAEIEKAALGLREWHLADFAFSYRGVLKGEALADWLNEFLGIDDIAAMPRRLGVTVTDLSEGRAALVVRGNPGAVARASSSVPGGFVPVQSQGRTYVDGGVLTVLPVRFARALGADVVLAVDIYCGTLPPPRAGVFFTALATYRLQSCALGEADFAAADVLIRPEAEPENFLSFGSREKAIEAGYRATRTALPRLRAILAERRGAVSGAR